MCVSLVHYLHPETSSIQNVCPGVQDFTLTILDRLVEVETVQVEGHRGNTKCGEPDTNDRPGCQEEVKTSGVVERCVLEDQTTEVTMGCDDVVCLFLLTELVTVVLGLSLSGFTNQRRSNQ